MATQPKRSYKNVARLPPETKVSIFVDVPPSLYNESFVGDNSEKSRTLSEDYILRCFAQSMALGGIEYDRNLWDKYFMHYLYEESLGTFVYEDMTLREMSSPENPSYKKLEENLKWIANTLQCHISVFVGHVDTCQNYIDTIYKQTVEQLKFFSSLPTIFLIIACRGDEIAFQLNTESKYSIFRQHRIAFFGFQDLLHIHEGEIYSTKLPDTARSKAICDSQEIKGLFERLSADFNAAGIEPSLGENVEPQVILDIYRKFPNLEIFKCCRTKLGRLYSDFVKGLGRRHTTKYPKEKLAAKFKQYTQSRRSDILQRDYTTITTSDGINCETEPCEIPNLYEADELLAQSYNKKGEFHALFRELKSYILPSYTYTHKNFTSSNDYHNSVESFFRRIQDLKDDERSVFTYTPNPETISPIIFDILNYKFASPTHSTFKLIRFILQKYGSFLDFTKKTPEMKRSFLHFILENAHFTLKEEYFLFKLIYDSIPTQEEREKVFFLEDVNNNIAIAFGHEFRHLLFLFYIEKFGPKLKDVSYTRNRREGNLLHAVCVNYISQRNTEEDIMLLQIIQGLLNAGVNPNETITIDEYTPSARLRNKYKPLELYTDLFLPPYPPSLISMFARYGMTNDDSYFTKQKDFYEGLISNRAKRVSFDNVLKNLRLYLNEFEENYYRSFQYGGMRYRYNRYPYNENNYSENSDEYRERTREYRATVLLNKLTAVEKPLYLHKAKLFSEFAHSWNDYRININFFRDNATTVLPIVVQEYTDALVSRKGVKKHGSKVRRTYKYNKANLNKTIKQRFNSILFNVNGEKMITDLLGKILELAKKPQFTKEEKANYKKRPLTISKSELEPREKYDRLKEIYEQMEATLKTR